MLDFKFLLKWVLEGVTIVINDYYWRSNDNKVNIFPYLPKDVGLYAYIAPPALIKASYKPNFI